MTLPVFAAMSRLPALAVDAAWVAASIAAALATLRLFGVPWRWAVLLLAWPPFFQGIQVGNVAVLLALLFAIAPWVGGGLIVAAVFKIYSGLAALWLVRERRLMALAAGIGIIAGTAIITLPLVGPERWRAWLDGLEWFRASQPLLADYLYGFGLPRYIPFVAAVAIAGAVTIAAVRMRGPDGLARLGLATVVASPSLYAHGLIVGLPAFLALRARWLWTVLAITSVAPGIAWWAAIGLGVAAWWLPALRRSGAGPERDGELHPLPPGVLPWPAAPWDGRPAAPAPRPTPAAPAAGQGTV
jgi:hypothetical protein